MRECEWCSEPAEYVLLRRGWWAEEEFACDGHLHYLEGTYSRNPDEYHPVYRKEDEA